MKLATIRRILAWVIIEGASAQALATLCFKLYDQLFSADYVALIDLFVVFWAYVFLAD